MKTVQLWLGHTTISTTADVYTDIQRDFENKEVKRLDTYFEAQNDTQI